VNGKKIVERKDEMKKRGLRSPDCADALLLTFSGHPQPREADRSIYRDQGSSERSGWTG